MNHALWDDPHFTWDSPLITWDGRILDPTTVAFFFPPVTGSFLTPERVKWSDRFFYPQEPQPVTPDSGSYRKLIANVAGIDVTAGGITYPGGRWAGPLTDAQISALSAAGYADRIVYVTGPGELPPALF